MTGLGDQTRSGVVRGRAVEIARLAVGLAVVAWLLRPTVAPLATGGITYHAIPVGTRVGAALSLPVLALVLGTVGVAVDRVLLHGVAWSLAGALANTGEMVATGSVADYLRVGHIAASPGDACLAAGVVVLVIGAVRIGVRGLAGATRSASRAAYPGR